MLILDTHTYKYIEYIINPGTHILLLKIIFRSVLCRRYPTRISFEIPSEYFRSNRQFNHVCVLTNYDLKIYQKCAIFFSKRMLGHRNVSCNRKF